MQEVVYHSNYQIEESYWWFTARNRILRTLIAKYTELPKNSQVLDVGCGTGGFASYISKDYEMLCLDTSEIALEYCRKRGLHNLFNMNLQDFPKDEWKVRAIMMLDVVEHIENDVGVVKTVFDILPAGGYYIATVPAYKWLWSHHDVMHMHFRRYTKASFTKLLKNAGFEIVFSSYCNTFLFPLAVFKRFMDKLTGKKSDSPVDKVSPFINTLFDKIFGAETGFLKLFGFPFGVSVAVVARKI